MAILAVRVSQCTVLIDAFLVVLSISLGTGALEKSIQISKLFALSTPIISHLASEATIVAEFTGCLCCSNTFVVAIYTLASAPFLDEIVSSITDCASSGCGFALLAFWRTLSTFISPYFIEASLASTGIFWS